MSETSNTIDRLGRISQENNVELSEEIMNWAMPIALDEYRRIQFERMLRDVRPGVHEANSSSDFSSTSTKCITTPGISAIHSNLQSNLSTFPSKLYDILSKPEYEDIICWADHGKCWRVLKPKELEKILPLYFRHGKYSSFQRQLYIWGFVRVRSGPDVNSYSHEYFLRNEPEVASKMNRKKKAKEESPR
mmetsp:Transcript_3100/g.4875  ORF Transcript_3100/g.4875 Transcript_3100/m.4875 type:complete len:190 (+) Transcript_3100:52-621(+)